MTATWREAAPLMHDLRARVARASVLATVNPTAPIPAPLAAPRSWFEPVDGWMQRAAGSPMTPFTVVLDGPDAGRVYGDVAPRGQCILDGRTGCWTIPGPDQDDLGMSMNGVYETAEGETISVGVIPMDCNHAPDGTAEEAIDFMAHSGAQLAIVKYVHTPTSIAAVGVLAPGITWSDAVRARAAAQSGDWRALLSEIRFDDGRPPEFRFTGSVTVNVPGLPLAVRLAARPHPMLPFARALVIPQEATMTTHTESAEVTIEELDEAFGVETRIGEAIGEPRTAIEVPLGETGVLSAHTAGTVYVLRPRPAFQCHDEVFFSGGARRGMVVQNAMDEAGAPLVVVREAFEDGTIADDTLDVTVPASDCVGTGRMFDYEDYTDAIPSDIVVAAAAPEPVVADAPHACSCQTASQADTESVTAATDMGASPAAPIVDDPTNDILLERLDTLEKLTATLNERLDATEAQLAAGRDAASIAAALELP